MEEGGYGWGRWIRMGKGGYGGGKVDTDGGKWIRVGEGGYGLGKADMGKRGWIRIEEDALRSATYLQKSSPDFRSNTTKGTNVYVTHMIVTTHVIMSYNICMDRVP